ncbi:575_t:CDS:2 [Funneliformis mosseae]|uniref:575_t:CDS:1 n=1 Tax=Funneliformis mosseae TaxID=27381 RepID=A0A9N9BYH5_FUNMO|nr:575_t:CDS:2 [Funneliformis mosseae]
MVVVAAEQAANIENVSNRAYSPQISFLSISEIKEAQQDTTMANFSSSELTYNGSDQLPMRNLRRISITEFILEKMFMPSLLLSTPILIVTSYKRSIHQRNDAPISDDLQKLKTNYQQSIQHHTANAKNPSIDNLKTREYFFILLENEMKIIDKMLKTAKLLDTQFRLLREDMPNPIVMGVLSFITALSKGWNTLITGYLPKKIQSVCGRIQVYRNVEFVNDTCDRRKGLFIS